MAQSPLQPPNPEIREGEFSRPTDFGGSTGALPQSGGMSVSSGGTGSDIKMGAGVLKTLLSTTGRALGNNELTTAATVLGGATGIYKLVDYFSKGMPGGTTGVLGAGGVAASVVSALLSVAANESGDPNLMKAAQAAGIATNALGLASTAASIAGVVTAMGGVAAAGAAAGTATAAAAGATAGLSVGAGAAFAPIAAFMLIDAFGPLFGKDEGLLGISGGIQDQMKPAMGNYATFNQDLFQDAGQQGKSFGLLGSALPYVQNKAELGQLINTYKNYLQTTTGISLTDAVNNPYRIAAIPGIGPRTHGQATQPVDWSNQQNQLQGAIDALYGILPGDPISGEYGAPDGSLDSMGDASLRLWNQFLPEAYATPPQVYSQVVTSGSGPSEYGSGYGMDYVTAPQPGYNPSTESLAKYNPDWKGYAPGNNWGLEPVFDPESRSWVTPNSGGPRVPSVSGFFEKSSYWDQLMRPPTSPQPVTNAAPGTADFRPSTIDMTGGMRTGVGQPMGAFGGARSPLGAAGGATVNPNITQGIAGQTGFIPGGSKL